MGEVCRWPRTGLQAGMEGWRRAAPPGTSRLLPGASSRDAAALPSRVARCQQKDVTAGWPSAIRAGKKPITSGFPPLERVKEQCCSSLKGGQGSLHRPPEEGCSLKKGLLFSGQLFRYNDRGLKGMEFDKMWSLRGGFSYW